MEGLEDTLGLLLGCFDTLGLVLNVGSIVGIIVTVGLLEVVGVIVFGGLILENSGVGAGVVVGCEVKLGEFEGFSNGYKSLWV